MQLNSIVVALLGNNNSNCTFKTIARLESACMIFRKFFFFPSKLVVFDFQNHNRTMIKRLNQFIFGVKFKSQVSVPSETGKQN